MSKFEDYASLVLPISLGFITRLFLATSSYQHTISRRVEISTPLNDWKRAYEGIHLMRQGISPYTGDTLHEYPINLQLYSILDVIFGHSIHIVFAVVDCLTVLILSRAALKQILILTNDDPTIARCIVTKENDLTSKENSSSVHKSLDLNYAKRCSRLIVWIYSLSPATILPCAGQSTTVFTNFLVAAIYLLIATAPRSRSLICLLLALLACNTLHYSTLALPVFVALEMYGRRDAKTSEKKTLHDDEDVSIIFNKSILWSLQLFGIFVGLLLILSYVSMGYSLDFVQTTFFFVLKINDLTPNIGMCWYFFTEMFDHFHSFFLWVYQINTFVHAIPLCIYLRKNPFLAFYIVLLFASFVQPYPSLANIGLVSSILPQWSHLLNYTKRGHISACAIVTCVALAPILWHLWIVMGTANANFYFGITLVFVEAQVVILADLLSAHGARNSLLKSQIKPLPSSKR